ncbi:CIR protein [Plasmodium chabaudi chabaudi]|uniref:CIR protein n=1 Tax=Plasmodium chabaudi chabaudi TaxID=31271 RepID=A0A4V0K2Q6_PLACU|nr:CIR protein [Plasmodium chabaudi chabaudi]VTZ67134.1 CIR protein [Plasmodium chabaudi chabaudi]|eukprot:XP_016653243.1 CIR protein [Plasmodium chabaudi chabaudi]
MNTKKMCKLLLEGDGYFNDENVDTKKINKNTIIKGYCSNNGCKTNEDYINALSAYIYKEFKNLIKRNQKHNDYDEYLLMWISDKLLKIHKKGKGKKIGIGRMDDFTLKRAYEEYLKNHKQRLDYWYLLDMIKDLKEANLWYMSEYYKLLNLICKLITDYYNGVQTKQLYKYPADCSHQYKNLYLNISECKPYLDLLNKLKGIYDDFSSSIKKNDSNNELATKLKKLTPKDGKEMDAVRGFKTYNFSGSQCKFPKKKIKPKKPNPPRLPPSSKEEPPPQRKTPSSSQTSNASPKTKTGESSSSNVHDGSKIEIKASDNSEGNTGSENRGPSSGLNDPISSGVEGGNKDGGDNEPGISGGKSKEGTSKRTEHEGTSPPGPQASNQEAGSEHKGSVGVTTQIEQKNGSDTPKGTDDGAGSTKDNPNIGENGKKGSDGVTANQITHPKSGIPSSETGNENSNKRGSDDGPGGDSGGSKYGEKNIDRNLSNTGGAQGDKGGSVGGSGIPVSGKGGTNNVQGDSGGGKGNGTGVSGGGQTSTNGGVGDPGTNQGGGSGSEQGGSDSPPVENGTQNTPREPFNIGPFISSIALKGMEKLNDAINSFEMIKNKFIGATKYIYNTTLPSIKNGFDKSIDFFNGIINSISIDFKQVDPPAGSDNNKSEPDGTGSGPSAPDGPSSPPKDSPHHDSNNHDSQGSQTLQTSQDPQNPQTSLLPSSKDQAQEQQLSPGTSGNQSSDRTNQEGPQKPEPAPVLKPEHSGSELKGNGITEIGDIYIFKGYKQFVILTIVLLIPIALAIIYKYLSFGRRNKLKKKNNMKKVINMVGVNKTTKTVINSSDGKKQIQIIIKSYSQKKPTKKSINSVNRKKSPSLNIYQLMQADPVPFINLFFLLIFFVYKRKRDFIE